MTLTFYARKDRPNKNLELPIGLAYNHNGQMYRIKTGVHVHPDYWNEQATKDNWVRETHPDANQKNLLLKQFKRKHEQMADAFALKNNHQYPTASEMKDLCDPKKSDKSFWGLWGKWVEHQRAGRGMNNVTAGTLKNYTKVKGRLEEYQLKKGFRIDFTVFNLQFYDSFVDYCTEKKNGESTIGSYVKIIKSFLKWANMHHQVGVTGSVMESLKVTDPHSYFVSLTIEEFMVWRDMSLAHDPVLDKSRDAAILQCCLGCRYSDLQIMLVESVSLESGRYIFRLTTKKNERAVEFPLADTAVNILKKYQGIHPKDWIPRSHHQNKLVKDLAKLAGMYEKVVITEGTGNFREDKTYFKYELVTTHTFRRTAVNILRLEGIPDEEICRITGQAMRTLQRYKHPNMDVLIKGTKIWDRPAPKDSPEPKER